MQISGSLSRSGRELTPERKSPAPAYRCGRYATRRRRNQNGLLLTAVIATSFWSLTSVGLLYCFFIFIPKSPRSDQLEPVQFATSTRLLLGHFAGNRHSRNGSQFLLFDQSRLRVRLLHGYPPTYTLTVQIFRLAEVAPVRTITSLLSSTRDRRPRVLSSASRFADNSSDNRELLVLDQRRFRVGLLHLHPSQDGLSGPDDTGRDHGGGALLEIGAAVMEVSFCSLTRAGLE